jgi:hypothetical protein
MNHVLPNPGGPKSNTWSNGSWRSLAALINTSKLLFIEFWPIYCRNLVGLNSEETDFELSLRPTRLRQYIGQNSIKSNLEVFIKAAKLRHEPLDHVLLFGPPGLGKTTLSINTSKLLFIEFWPIYCRNLVGLSDNSKSVSSLCRLIGEVLSWMSVWLINQCIVKKLISNCRLDLRDYDNIV